MGGGGKTYLAPPHIFEWGGGPIPPAPLFRRPYSYYIQIILIINLEQLK